MEFSNYNKSFSLEGRLNIGVLVIHGFTSTPQSIEYYFKKMNEYGFHVEVPVLTGHAASWEEMNKITYHEWIKNVNNSYKKLADRVSKVFVAGLSMGGALALKLAELNKNINGIILINHAIFLKRDWRLLFLLIIMHFKASDAAKIGGDLKDPDAYELTYNRIPLKGVYQLMRLQKEVRRIHTKITKPVLIFKSVIDHVLPDKCAQYTMKHIASKEKKIILLENSYHAATLDYDKDLIVEKSKEFINLVSAPNHAVL